MQVRHAILMRNEKLPKMLEFLLLKMQHMRLALAIKMNGLVKKEPLFSLFTLLKTSRVLKVGWLLLIMTN